MQSQRYICAKHRLPLVLASQFGFAYWLCPMPCCRFMKPCKSGAKARKGTRAEALTKIKAEVVRIGTNGTRQGHKFAEEMFASCPELRRA